jgi:hypothetical protein
MSPLFLPADTSVILQVIMASSSTSSLFVSPDETNNGVKLTRIVTDCGTKALSTAFQNIHGGDLKVLLSCTCPPSATCKYHILLKLKKLGIIKQNQWDKLYPVPPNAPNIDDFDITLLCILLRNICGLSPPPSGWDNLPNASDHSVKADIIRIKLFRNEHFGHKPKTAVSMQDFKTLWAEISLPLLRLRIDKKDIDRIKNQMFSDDILNHLRRFNFQTEIGLFNNKCTTGSREWVFKQVYDWFNDSTSEDRTFVISGLAGMGKSVIAAGICKRFAEHIGASHFFQYNNSQYNNPKLFLQSLAWQLCNVIPAYKEALEEELRWNSEIPLNLRNIQDLFSTLFKEPFSGISDPGKRILIVLDAVDEREYQERDELAELISNQFYKLPSYLRFLITTRPENNLLFAFARLNPSCPQANVKLNLNDIKLVKQNLEDIKLVLQDKIPSSNINSLAQDCNGSMLHAFLLTEMCKMNIHTLPRNIEGYYKDYFQRLQIDLLKHLGVSGEKFLSFLTALAFANEPLPEAFLRTLFGFENTADAKQKVAKAINVLSSLLVIREDKSISFFHKSIRDWLVDDGQEHYPVDEKYGHQTLFYLCVKKLKELEDKPVRKESVASVVVSYALKHWVSHMLKGLEDAEILMDGFVKSYLLDLEVMFASVFVNVDVVLDNVVSLARHETFEHVSADTNKTMRELYLLIRKFASSLRNYPQTFLQNVVNEGGEQLSSNASDLLRTRYKDILYFQLDKQYRPNNACELLCHISGDILSIDVTREGDYVVVGYTRGGIELFSLATGMSEWKIQDFILKLPPPYNDDTDPDVCMLPHNIVFHPRKKLILPGNLDEVLTFQGTLTTGPFRCDESSSVFSNCCFSMDGSKMVTNYGNDLFVWNVSNGGREMYLPCNRLLHSLSFSASGDFLGTTDIDNVFRVYDMSNDYNVKRIDIDSEFPVEIFSTFDDHNPWLCSVDRVLKIVSHDHVGSSNFGSIKDIALPSNVHSSREFKSFAQHREQSWLLKIRKDVESWSEWTNYTAVRYILTGGKSVLFFSRDSNIMRLYSMEGLAQTEQSPSNAHEYIFSNISSNGDFVYLSNHLTENFSVCELVSKGKYSRSPDKIHFVVVKDGVIFYCKGCECSNPELWNSDVTECLSSFYQLAGTRECLSVSDEVIAVVYFTRHEMRLSFALSFLMF